ncbi:phosphotransferase family protein [Paenibacillus silvisoli]|uniref:phosphotransferase family protein n=1 Tax=Paenibacillus silvisoli TaxID=3110539 RepID=UPI00280538C0|nr:aminoglycoside phosphotransferase family protein [Paenibacillus silvisoli]
MTIGKMIGRGKTADVYEWGKHEVIKVFHEAHQAAEEANNASLIAGLDIRTPRFGGLVEHEGRQCLIYERIRGHSMLWQIEPKQESILANAKLMAELQHQLHGLQVEFTPNLKQELTYKIKAAPSLSDMEKDRILASMVRLPEGRTLCHYDFHPDNILLAADGPVIIDWMNVLVGDAAADVARTSMMIRSHAVPPQAPGWLHERELRLLFHDTYAEAYKRLSGMRAEEIETWRLPTLAARIIEMSGEERNEIVRLVEEILA